MTRAEERALEQYPVEMYKEVGWRCVDKNADKRKYFVEGYQQAEKDNELTWKDIKEICVQSVLVEVDLGGLVSDERHYTEVLKRFKAQKGE